MNFLQWKFDLSVADLQSYNVSNRMTSSSAMNNLTTWLLTRVPHVLVSTGFCHSYTAANQLVRSGQVKLNDLPLSYVNQCVKIGDVVTVNELVRPTKFKDTIAPAHLLVNWKLGLILVKSNLTLTSHAAEDFLNKLSVDLKRKKVSGGLKNPLSTFVWRLSPFIRNLGR
jgi:ribosomal protein S4